VARVARPVGHFLLARGPFSFVLEVALVAKKHPEAKADPEHRVNVKTTGLGDLRLWPFRTASDYGVEFLDQTAAALRSLGGIGEFEPLVTPNVEPLSLVKAEITNLHEIPLPSDRRRLNR
jgi:hypothetical protein